MLQTALLVLSLVAGPALAAQQTPSNLNEQASRFVALVLPTGEAETGRLFEKQIDGYWVLLLDVGFVGGSGSKQYVAVFQQDVNDKNHYQLVGAIEGPEGQEIVGIKDSIRKGKSGPLLRLQTVDTMEEKGKRSFVQYWFNSSFGWKLDFKP